MIALALAALLATDGGVPAQMAARPTIGPLPALTLPAPQTFSLPNGLAVVAIARHASPLVAVQLVVRSGADSDPAALAGLAAATADMLDEGAGERDALAIARALDAQGAELRLGASRDGSTLSLEVPSSGFVRALGIAADVVLRPRFAAGDWQRVQNDRLTALVQRRDQPDAVAALVSDRALFGEANPYGRPAAGFERTLRAITVAELKGFYDHYWRPNNATLVVAGDFDSGALRATLTEAFGAWKRQALPRAPASSSLAATKPRFVLVDKPGAPQTVLRLVRTGAARSSPDRAALELVATVLGGSFTSRLNFNLREKHGYTYGAGARFVFLRRPGPFVASASVFSKDTDKALGEFFNELGGMGKGPISDEELTKGRALLQQQIAEALSTTGGTAGLYADLSLYGLPLDEPTRFTKALARADVASLRKLAGKTIDPASFTVVAVGDRKSIEPGLRALGLPAPQVRDADGEVVP
jgi:zinc protease